MTLSIHFECGFEYDGPLDRETMNKLAKVMMNSSYGKDGTKLLRKPHHTRLDQETDLLVSDPDIEVAEIEYYLPSAIFICALARQQLWKAVKLLRREFIYCDTDSVKVTARGREILESSPDFDIDDYRLGSWGYEGEYRTAKFVRQKTYSYEQWNKKRRRYERHYVVCGAPDDIKAVMDIKELYKRDMQEFIRFRQTIGEWLKCENPMYSPFDRSDEYTYRCTVCHMKNDKPTKFCPNCGAHMIGGKIK